jgi:hypothetical protein
MGDGNNFARNVGDNRSANITIADRSAKSAGGLKSVCTKRENQDAKIAVALTYANMGCANIDALSVEAPRSVPTNELDRIAKSVESLGFVFMARAKKCAKHVEGLRFANMVQSNRSVKAVVARQFVCTEGASGSARNAKVLRSVRTAGSGHTARIAGALKFAIMAKEEQNARSVVVFPCAYTDDVSGCAKSVEALKYVSITRFGGVARNAEGPRFVTTAKSRNSAESAWALHPQKAQVAMPGMWRFRALWSWQAEAAMQGVQYFELQFPTEGTAVVDSRMESVQVEKRYSGSGEGDLFFF